jgi:hypothetical protein
MKISHLFSLTALVLIIFNAHPFSYQFPLATAIVNLSNIPPPKYLRLSL